MASADLHGLHVFVLEPDHETRDAMRTALESCGAFVTTPASVERAKALLRAVRPDILITDLAMQDRDSAPGREIFDIVRQLGVRVPWIAVTQGESRRETLQEEGFAEVVEKPFDPLRLCALVKLHALPAQGASIS